MTTNYKRSHRVGDQMRRELSGILQKDLKDPHLGFVTVTGVEVSDDLSFAKVFCSVLGDEADRKRSLRILNKAKGFLRGELARRLRLREAPEMVFKYDGSIERGLRIEEILEKIREEERAREEEKDR
jgi:ribosome-binding factor A